MENKDKETMRRYRFIYKGNVEIFKQLNNKECYICAKYIGQNYIGIKFENGIETTAFMSELIPI